MVKNDKNIIVGLDVGTSYVKAIVGVINEDIRVCTHPDHQGKGIGKFMINESYKIWPTAFAKVKLDNKLSIKLFESCGFTKKYYILTKK